LRIEAPAAQRRALIPEKTSATIDPIVPIVTAVSGDAAPALRLV